MTAADYATIRERLDHPQVVVWDPCAVTLSEDDPELPAPVSDGFMAFFEPFPRATLVRWVAEVSLDALVRFESLSADARPRHWMSVLIRWLAGSAAREELKQACQSGQAAFDALRHERREERETNPDCGWESNPLRDQMITLATTLAAVRMASPDQLMGPVEIASMFLGRVPPSRWWARCRALVPIADVTTAEIEWGDIELPPRPLADDLPGDGGPSEREAV